MPKLASTPTQPRSGSRASLQRRILGGFIVLDLVLVALGLANLAVVADLHGRVNSLSSRDLAPLTDMRAAQDLAYQSTIAGLAGALSTNPAARPAWPNKRRETWRGWRPLWPRCSATRPPT